MSKTAKATKRPRKYKKYPPATADRGATPENVARALLRPRRPVPQPQETAKRDS